MTGNITAPEVALFVLGAYLSTIALLVFQATFARHRSHRARAEAARARAERQRINARIAELDEAEVSRRARPSGKGRARGEG